MSVTVHQRPGVYSSYDASSVVSGSGSGKLVGLVAVNQVAAAGVAQTITSYDKAVTAFGSSGGQDMAELIRLALKNGAAGVVAVPVASAADYESGFAVLAAVEDVAVVLCDSTDSKVQRLLRESVLQASAARRERIAVVAGAQGETTSNLIARAKGLNCERVVLVAPGGVDAAGKSVAGLPVAAAVAGAIAGESDPAVPLGGAELSGLYGLAERYEDADLDRLILGGVTPVESVGGTVQVVRGVTTRTTTGDAADSTWRELTTIRILDDVIPDLRTALRAKFRRAKNTERGRSAIRAQVVLELEDKLSREIITGYEDVAVTADSTDPTRCLVDFSFTVAHGLNQIWLSAHITV
jgi:hypothetical protein